MHPSTHFAPAVVYIEIYTPLVNHLVQPFNRSANLHGLLRLRQELCTHTWTDL